MAAWLENRPRMSDKKLECGPGKGRKMCPSCKAIVRSNSLSCKKCSHSFAAVEKEKQEQAAIVWPEELRRARNESSRRAAAVRRRNREEAIASGDYVPGSGTKLGKIITKRKRSNPSNKRVKRKNNKISRNQSKSESGEGMSSSHTGMMQVGFTMWTRCFSRIDFFK